MSSIVELVQFRTRAGIATDDFLKSIPPVNAFLRGQDGFVNRRLACDPEGNWIDCVEWRDLEAARAADKALMAEPGARDFLGMIDMASIAMGHYLVRSRISGAEV